MKLSFTKSDLSKAVSIASKAVSSKTSGIETSINECILIDASSNSILFTGNNLDIGIETLADGVINEKGSIAINANLLSELVRKLPDGIILVESDENDVVTISCDGKKYTLNGLPAGQFSYLPEVEKNNKLVLSQFTLKELIRQTSFSLDVNDNNPIVTGELFEVKNNKLKLVALDNHRIAIRNVSLKENTNESYMIIPGKSLNEISKILDSDEEKDVIIYFSEKNVLFEFNDTKVVSRLITGEYFNINRMISNDYETKIEVNKSDLINAIDRETIFIKDSDKKPIILNITNEGLRITVKTSLGEGIEDVDAFKEGKDLKIGFNPKFLLDALKVIDDEKITIFFVNQMTPCYIKDKDESYIYIILPVNFTE